MGAMLLEDHRRNRGGDHCGSDQDADDQGCCDPPQLRRLAVDSGGVQVEGESALLDLVTPGQQPLEVVGRLLGGL